jgi:hypothetical protein
LLGLLALVVVGAVTFHQWPDIRRYAKIKLMSQGSGHPRYVPVAGRSTYPHQHGGGTPDGRGDFDSASRGGPTAKA